MGTELGIHPATVAKWRKRFAADRLESLADEPRPGKPRTVGDERVEEVVVRTLEPTPPDATHWSTRSMAAAAGLSQSTVSRIWRTFGLKPHMSETFRFSTDPQFIDKVRDITGLYLAPPEHAPVLCVDEKSQIQALKSQIQALERSAPALPVMPGTRQRRTHDYLRNGTTTLFAALNAATGEMTGEAHRPCRAAEFKKLLARIGKETPAGLDVHLVCDNYATHKTPVIQKRLAAHPRFHMHFTSTYSSWLSQVERWFGLLTGQHLRRASIRPSNAASAPGSRRGTRTRNRSCGLRAQMRPSNASAGYLQQINDSTY